MAAGAGRPGMRARVCACGRWPRQIRWRVDNISVMRKETSIAWCDHTFNPWWGCQRVSPGCEHCYAETFAKRLGKKIWGPTADRRFFSDAHWNEPLKWAFAARREGVRRRVFCASMADVFEDRHDLENQRERLWKLIKVTPDLDWLLLSKRPENFDKFLPWGSRAIGHCHARTTCNWCSGPWSNIWLGCTAEDQRRLDERSPILLDTPAAVRFISAEPLLGPLQFHPGTIGCIGNLAETFGNPQIHQ